LDDDIPISTFTGILLNIPWTPVFNPFDPGIIWGIAAILLLLFLTALMCSVEVALFALDNNRINSMETEGDKVDRSILKFIERPKTLLATLVLSITFFTLGIVLIFENVFEKVFTRDFIESQHVLELIIKVSFETFIIVLFAEVIPKIYASQNSYSVSRALIPLVQFFSKIFSPFVRTLTATSNFFERRLEGAAKNVSAQDIDEAIDITSDKDEDAHSGTKILKGIVKFGNITVTQIMRSRMDVVAIDHDASYDDLKRFVRESGYSRIPVYKDDIDKIEGVLYIKDLLKHLDHEKDFDWRQLVRPAFFVPDNKKIDDLLKDFQSKRTHMAIVVDEYGGTSGIVTLEDVLEEVIGDIKDEFDDVSEIDYKKIDNQNYIFEGRTALNDVCKVLEIPTDTFEDVRGEADSLAGLILELNAEIPKEGDELKYGRFNFLILEADKVRVIRVKITIS
jgi:gliding motility-associated protein GldE